MSEFQSTSGSKYLHIQFDTLEQQSEVASLGMWLFLATEVLFFGGLILTYSVYRVTYPEAFARAGRELNLVVGTINTAVLLVSSYFMARAVSAIRNNKVRQCTMFLGLTWIFGFIFLGFKAYEYADDFHKHLVPAGTIGLIGPDVPIAKMFYYIYYSMTGLHAIHLIIGLGVVATIFVKTRRGRYSDVYHNGIEVAGLYWHFIDIVWIFLYPLLYLMDRNV